MQQRAAGERCYRLATKKAGRREGEALRLARAGCMRQEGHTRAMFVYRPYQVDIQRWLLNT